MGSKEAKVAKGAGVATTVEPSIVMAPTRLDKASVLLNEDDVQWLRGRAAAAGDELSLWHRLFSSAVDGRSFARLCDSIAAEGPTVVVVSDAAGNVFGGCSSTWLGLRSSTALFGDGDRCAVFTLRPIRAFYAGSQRACQLLSTAGFGMGGSAAFPAWFVDSSLETGITNGPVACFAGSPMLTQSGPRFDIRDIEVWCCAVPPEPRSQELKVIALRKAKRAGREGILSGNEAAIDKQILELGGHEWASDSLAPLP